MTVERWLRIIVLRARSLFLRSRVEAELQDDEQQNADVAFPILPDEDCFLHAL